MSDAPPQKKCPEGTPAWVMTFADLMSLLMCFFVLLFSFSEMDVSKYKQIAGSMREAFGVQRDVKTKDPPRGVNVVAREFSPGRPDPTPFNVVKQNTANDLKRYLDMGNTKVKRDRVGNKAKDNIVHNQNRKMNEDTKKAATDDAKDMTGKESSAKGARKTAEEEEKLRKLAEEQKRLARDADKLNKALGNEIKDGHIDVNLMEKRIVINIREKASFRSGGAELRPEFLPTLGKISAILIETEGHIVVAGHTDNIPIHTSRFRSNWELSASRAVTVVHALVQTEPLPQTRFEVSGYADTRPLGPNDTAENRSRNRRVEIIIERGDEEPDRPVPALDADSPDLAGDVERELDGAPEDMPQLPQLAPTPGETMPGPLAPVPASPDAFEMPLPFPLSLDEEGNLMLPLPPPRPPIMQFSENPRALE